ncbi:acyltransferase [Agromyces sp. NPDC058136]|uniref:acyltransferase family protein n=1 Tax=Agromyces sp. NPDC058136 TaxID=3346354 RepID=UPI0036DC52CB
MTETLERPRQAARPAASVRERTPVRRDPSIDAIRVVLLVVVFVLHAMMVGVSVGPDGPVLENALEGQAWFGPVSWVVQIMPLFFIVGGFAGLTHWRAMRARGATAAEYVRARIERLVRPAIALVAVVAAGLVTLSLAGVPGDVVAVAGFRIGQPLWFLAVYLGASALVPFLVGLHERAPVLTPLALLGGVVAVDLLRLSTGIEPIGYANLALVWLLVQQLGFHLADGAFDGLSRRTLGGLAAASLLLLAVLTATGPYPVDMLVNLNPPTFCLVVLGVAQLALFQLVRPRIAAWVRERDATRAISFVGERAMTVYLWHMPVLVGLAGLALAANAAIGLPLPDPLSAGWWASRPIWLLVAGVAVAGAVLLFARFERGRRAPRGEGAARVRPVSGRAAAFDAVLAVTGVVVLLVAGFGPLPSLIALALLGSALLGSTVLGSALFSDRRRRPVDAARGSSVARRSAGSTARAVRRRAGAPRSRSRRRSAGTPRAA